MRSFFFGPEQSLYGTYHPPREAATGLEHAVLICGSLGAEYMRSYRSLWQCAEALTARNTHVLRFDYFATGESAGRQSEADWMRCLQDVRTACAWLQSETAMNQIRVVGHRIGALIAVNALADQPVGLDAVTLWDPVVDGSQWFDVQQTLHAESTRRSNRFRSRTRQYAERDTDEFLGFHFADHLVKAIKSSRLDVSTLAAMDVRCSLGVSDPSELPEAWLDAMARLQPTVDELKPESRWASISDVGRRLIVRPSPPKLVDLVLA